MKRNLFFISIALVLLISSCRAQKINHNLQEFIEDFSTANVHLLGHLMLYGDNIGDYKGDISTLTYDKYLVLLKDSETISTKNITKTVKNADRHFFLAKKNTFLIVIYSKQLNAVIYDNAATAFCDSVKVFQKNEPIPDLAGFITRSQ